MAPRKEEAQHGTEEAQGHPLGTMRGTHRHIERSPGGEGSSYLAALAKGAGGAAGAGWDAALHALSMSYTALHRGANTLCDKRRDILPSHAHLR